jgi:hypothetical protein
MWTRTADRHAASAMGMKRISNEKYQEANRLNADRPRNPPPR